MPFPKIPQYILAILFSWVPMTAFADTLDGLPDEAAEVLDQREESDDADDADESDDPDSVENSGHHVATTSSLGSRTESDLVTPVTTLAGPALDRRRSGGSVGEVLDGVPGISNADFGPGVGRPSIRGLQGPRVQILEDGMRTSDVSKEGVDHIVAGDTLGAHSIELIRGPASLLYGSGATGGVVNTVTGRFDPIFGAGPNGTLHTTYSPNGHDRQAHAELELPLHDTLALRLQTQQRRSDDFQISGFQVADGVDDHRGRDGQLINSDVQLDTYALTGVWSDEPGYVAVGYEFFDTEYGIPEPFDPVGDQSDEFERIFADHHRLDLRSEFYRPFSGIEALRLNAAFTQFHQREDELEFSRDDTSLQDQVTEVIFDKDELDARLELTHLPIGPLTGVFGLDLNRDEFVADDPRDGRDFFIQPVTTQSAGIFAVERLTFGATTVEFGARIDVEESRPDPVTDPQTRELVVDGETLATFDPDPGLQRYTPASASLGARHDFTDALRVRASSSLSQRAPSSEQLYAFGRHGAAGTWEVGDPDLDLETYLNSELSLLASFDDLRFELTGFYNRVDDFIYLERLPDEDGQPTAIEGTEVVFNAQDDVDLYGLEATAGVELQLRDIRLTPSLWADFLRGQLRDGDNLPAMTPPRAGADLDLLYQSLNLHLAYQRVFSQERTGPAESSTDGFHLLGADLEWTPARAQGQASIFLRGRNLLNEAGRRHQSFFKDRAPILGRQLIAGLRYHFGS